MVKDMALGGISRQEPEEGPKCLESNGTPAASHLLVQHQKKEKVIPSLWAVRF